MCEKGPVRSCVSSKCVRTRGWLCVYANVALYVVYSNVHIHGVCFYVYLGVVCVGEGV